MVLVLLPGFVVFPAKLSIFGVAGLCSLVTVKAGIVPVLLPAGPPLVVPGGTLNILPGGSALVLLLGGRTLPNLGGMLVVPDLTVLLPLPGGNIIRRVPVLLPEEGSAGPRRPGRPVCPFFIPPVLLLGGRKVPDEGGFVEFPPGVCRAVQLVQLPTWLPLLSY